MEKKFFVSQQKSFSLGEQLCQIKNKLFGKSSEKIKDKPTFKRPAKEARKRVRLPSERYFNLDLIEKKVELDKIPSCPCCSNTMVDSGMTEDSEYLSKVPAHYYVVREMRTKYRCSGCHSSLVTAPSIPRIKAGSSFSDDLIIDAACSKYCDLIPMDRYTKIAERAGVKGLPANSLIQCTHNLASFLTPVFKQIEKEVKASKVLHADETPHRMLEGDKKSNWYLWGFSSATASYFEARDTRSGTVASDFLEGSNCKYLVSDVYSGYAKAVRIANEKRKDEKIENIYCNAHARRKFKDSLTNYESESRFFLYCYRKIYYLYKNKNNDQFLITMNREKIKSRIRTYFELMRKKAHKLQWHHSKKSSIMKAINYFLNNYAQLTKFIDLDNVPIDNNCQERLMRSPVVGRKTWWGNHSKKGAATTSLLFTIVETCKLNKVNPRKYIQDMVYRIHQNQATISPSQYQKESQEEESADKHV